MLLVFIEVLIKLKQIDNLQWFFLVSNIQEIYIKFDYFINFYFDSIRLYYFSEKSQNFFLFLFPWKWPNKVISTFKKKINLN